MAGPALAAALLLAFLEAVSPAPDPDFCAHAIWARNLASGTVPEISVDARVDDCSIYYPNTVPKPLQLVLATAGELLGGGASHAVIRIAVAALAVAAASGAAQRLAPGNPRAAVYGGLLVGFHPVFVSLALGGSPSIAFLALLFTASPSSSVLSILARPEGLLYGSVSLLRSRRPALLALLLPAALAWPALNLLLSGSASWSVDEVRYAVMAMPYTSPGPFMFWAWAALRGVMVMGPILFLALVSKAGTWPHSAGALMHLVLLSASLAAGSLVLPRYVDQIFILALPWAAASLAALPPPRFAGRRLVSGVAFAGAMFLWVDAAPSLVRESELGGSLDSLGTSGWEGRLAANELLVPRIALAAGIDDPRSRFVALDRMAFENADPETLGIGTIVVFPHGLYLSERTSAWLLDHPRYPPDTLAAR